MSKMDEVRWDFEVDVKAIMTISGALIVGSDDSCMNLLDRAKLLAELQAKDLLAHAFKDSTVITELVRVSNLGGRITKRG